MKGATLSELLAMKPTCRNCEAVLEIDEIHYYDHGDGTATCNNCEADWLAAINAWRSGRGGDEPPLPP
jgi:transposase